jgi:hypothetical protein
MFWWPYVKGLVEADRYFRCPVCDEGLHDYTVVDNS